MQEHRRPPHAPLRPRFAFQHQLQPQMAKRASIPLLLLAALIGSAAAAPRAPLALHFAAAILCGSVRALVARPRYVRRPVTRLRSTIDDTDIEVDARILQAKQDLLERVYAGEAGVPVGEPPVLVNADPCDEEAIICEVDEDASDPGHVTSFSAAAAPARAMTAAAAIPLPDKEVVFMDALKETVDVDGIAGTVGDGIALLFGDTVRRRLWSPTRKHRRIEGRWRPCPRARWPPPLLPPPPTRGCAPSRAICRAPAHGPAPQATRCRRRRRRRRRCDRTSIRPDSTAVACTGH